MTKISLTPEKVLFSERDRLPAYDAALDRWGHTQPGYDIAVIAGQSNAVGFSGNASVDSKIDWKHNRIWQWSPTGAGEPDYALKRLEIEEPLRFQRFENIPDIDQTKWGPSCGTWFGRESVPFLGPNRDIVLIPAAVGGSNINDWNPVNGPFFLLARDALLAALAALPNARLRWIIRVQGEADVAQGMDPAEYETKLDAEIDGWRAIPTAETATIILGSMPPSWGNIRVPGSQGHAIDQIHRNTPLRKPRCIYVPGQDTVVVGDGIHYDAAAQRENGRRMAIKARSDCVLTNGAVLGVPSDLRVSGATVTWKGPLSDASHYAVERRPAGSMGAWTRITYSPKLFSAPGADVSYTFDDLSGDTEVRVASMYHDKISDFTDLVVVSFVAVPQHTFLLDIANASVGGDGKIASVPNLGTDAMPWTAPSGKGPEQVVVGARASLVTEPADAYLTYGNAPSGASYTWEIVVNHDDFEAQGVYLIDGGNGVPFSIWRGGHLSRKVYVGQAGVGDLIVVGQMQAGADYVLHSTYDLATQTLSLYINGDLVGQATGVSAMPSSGIVLNALANGTGGNNGRYHSVGGWIGTALTPEQVNYRKTLLVNALDLTLGELGPEALG